MLLHTGENLKYCRNCTLKVEFSQCISCLMSTLSSHYSQENHKTFHYAILSFSSSKLLLQKCNTSYIYRGKKPATQKDTFGSNSN